jgi:hypothetical protein
MVKYLITATMLAILSFTPWSFAQTADGKTPAEEWSCDEDTGALRGLCVAYCEAMDCHHEDTHASYEACWQVQDNYYFLSGGDVPPCDNPVNINEENDSDDTDDLG